MKIAVYECDASSREFLCHSTLDELLSQAAECCSDEEIAEIQSDLVNGRPARIACMASAYMEYVPEV